MNIEQSKRLKYGDTVHCPEDRGIPAHSGKVESIGTEVHKNIYNIEYIWISVRTFGKTSVWPSNRLN